MGGPAPHEMLIFPILFMGEIASGAGTIKFDSNLLKLGKFYDVKLIFHETLGSHIFVQNFRFLDCVGRQDRGAGDPMIMGTILGGRGTP